jgi:adenylate cyclase
MKDKKTLFIPLLSLLIAFSLLALHFKWLQRADFFVFDWQTKVMAKQLNADEDIVVITIDDYSITKMSAIAGRWVWPRTVHGELVEYLNQTTYQALVFDILFSEVDIYRPDADQYFNEVLAETQRAYFAMLQQNADYGTGALIDDLPKQIGVNKNALVDENARAHFILPLAINKNNWQLGTINFTPDWDGVGRRYDVHRYIAGWSIKSLPAKVVSQLGVKLPETQQVLLQWRGDRQQPFKTYSYADVYQAALADDQNFLQQFNDKIILVGSTASGLFDMRTTALNHELPGIYLLATAIDNLKNSRFLHQVNSRIIYFVATLLLIFIALNFLLINHFSRQVFSAALCLLFSSFVLIVTNQYLLNQQIVLFIGAIIILMAITFLCFSLSYGLQEYFQRKKAVAMFGRFLDPKVVATLVKQGKLDMSQLNQKCTLTILFSDIRNFTSLSEDNQAEEVVKLLNHYFNKQVQVIFKHKGTLDKFIGDCIMAFWGAPLTNDNQAVDAIDAALEMEQKLDEFCQTLPVELQGFDMGIGIHTGEAIVGMIGTDLRIDYTVIGDAVNLASRIEGLTKQSSRILVSEQTMLRAKGVYDFIFQGEHAVKGRISKVKLYQPLRRK